MSAQLIQALASSDSADIAEVRAIVAAYRSDFADSAAGPIFVALSGILEHPTRQVSPALQAAILDAEEAEAKLVLVIARCLAQLSRAARSPVAGLLAAVVDEIGMAAEAADAGLSGLLDDLDFGPDGAA